MFGSTNLGFGNFSTGSTQQSLSSPFGNTTTAGNTAAPTTSPFGAKPLSSLFGSTNPTLAFGSGAGSSSNTIPAFGAPSQSSAFGQTSTSNQPSGLFGSSPSTASPFGQAGANTGSNSLSAFGAPSNTFGAQPQLSSVFGALINKPPPFGVGAPAASNTSQPFGSASNTTSSPFGGSAFGLQPSALSNSSGPVDPNVNNGTTTKPYNPFIDKDLAGGPTTFRAISCMPEYRNFSFDELRLKDYQMNNRFPNPLQSNQQQSSFGANPATLAFGAPKPASGFGSAFGGLSAFGAQQNPSPFGTAGKSTGLVFGAPAQNNALPFGTQSATAPGASAFGGAASTGNAFGASSSSPFGAKPAFGQSNPSSGVFGQSNTNTASPFGAPQQQNSAFGNTQPQQNAFGASPFGSSNTNSAFGQSSSPFGASNTNAANPSSGIFGQNSSGASAFGANNQNQLSPFGQTNQNNNLFGGQQNSNAFGANKPATGFGASTQNTGGIFGSNNNNNNNNNATNLSGAFGQPALGGLFGSKPATGGGLFGQNTGATGTAPQGGLFGGAQTGQAPASGGLFGSKPAQPATGSLFGSQQNSNAFGQSNQQLTGGGLFGAKPAAPGGLFGSNTSATNNNAPPLGGMFGTNSNTSGTAPQGSLFGGNPPSTLGGSTNNGGLFGNKPAGQNVGGGGGGGLFSNTSNPAPSSGGGLFGSQQSSGNTGLFGSQPQSQQNIQGSQPNFANQQQQLQQLAQTSLANINATNPYGNNPLFQSITVPPQAVLGNANPDVVLLKSAQKPVTLGSVGHRKFALFRPLVYSQPVKPKPLMASGAEASENILPFRSTPPSSLLFDKNTDKAIRECDVFFPPAPAGFKKLVLDKSKPHLASTVFNTVDSHASDLPKRVDFAVSKDASSARPLEFDSSPKNTDVRSLTPLADSPLHLRTPSCTLGGGTAVNKDGYWMQPPILELEARSLSELRKVNGFKVGRQHYGQLEFLEPVDLLTFGDFNDIFNIIQFTSKVCDIYPNDDAPRPGEGLNIPVKITLEGCYPTNKKDKLPIVDPHDEIVKAHIANLKTIPVEFVAYEPESGAWSFIVRDCRRLDDDDVQDEDDQDGHVHE